VTVTEGRALPPGFLLGCATAAHQVEGHLDNDWSRWVAANPQVVADGSDATVAIDHYHRFREDLAELGAMRHTAHRLSIEWARIEPEPGGFEAAALAHYREVVEACRTSGMEPFVTLQHFTLPVWLAERGGLLSPETPALFARYAAACAAALGDRVRFWLTVNEPAVLAVMSHLFGRWPPQGRSPLQLRSALRTLLRMHAAAASAVREVSRSRGWEVRVSFAHHERPQVAATRSIADRAAALAPNWLFNRWFLDSAMSGRMLPPLGAGEKVPGLAGSLDYLGVNHYAHEVVHFDIRRPGMLFARTEPDYGLQQSAFGWAIHPEGFRDVLVDLWRRHRLPIYVTENGVSDREDELRPAFIVDHLNALLDAVAAGADVRGYLHWTAWDNFEWDSGYTQPFGLISVDRDTLQRTPKPSAARFSDICERHAVPPPMQPAKR
jgi:beta-glucosidase